MSQATSSFRLLATLGGIALCSGALLAMTYEWTKPRIAENERRSLEAAVVQVIPGAVSGENLKLEKGVLSVVEMTEANVYAGLNEQGERIGFALPGEARGYADVIRILYGYDPDTQTIIGLRVLFSNETPGLGDKIGKDPAFKANFTALDASLENDIVTVKNGEKEHPWEIDGISGATVSSVAVGQALQNSTRAWIPDLEASLKEAVHE